MLIQPKQRARECIFTTQLSGHVGSLSGDLVGSGASAPTRRLLQPSRARVGNRGRKNPRKAEPMGMGLLPRPGSGSLLPRRASPAVA